MEEILQFENIVNARGLGGLVVAGGRVVRYGRLLRTAHLSSASDADVRKLAEQYRLRRIFDFRTVGEAHFMPDREVPGAQYLLLPTLDLEEEKRSGLAIPDEVWLDLERSLPALTFDERFKIRAKNLYPSLAFSEFSQLQYATFLNLILETEEGSVLWHCSQGKDRTGMGAALLLFALGADRETVVADFDHSNTEYRELLDRLIGEVADLGGGEDEFDVIRAFIGVSTKNFVRTLDMIDREFGSMQQYLHERIGITEADMAVLRDRYTDNF